MKEEWRPVKGYEGYYEVSHLGRVRSIDRAINSNSPLANKTMKGRILSIGIKSNGYGLVVLSVSQKKKTFHVHSLVVNAFMEKKDGLFPNHKNGIKTDNRLDNLELVTRSQNMKHAYALGLR